MKFISLKGGGKVHIVQTYNSDQRAIAAQGARQLG